MPSTWRPVWGNWRGRGERGSLGGASARRGGASHQNPFNPPPPRGLSGRAAAGRGEGRLPAEERAALDDLLDLPAQGEGRALYRAMDEATRQMRRRSVIAGLVKRVAAERPVFLAVEDVHWADAILLDDLAALGAVTTQAPLILALTTRPEGDPLDRSWRAKLGAAAVSTIDLSPLSAAEAGRLAARVLGNGRERVCACIQP